MITEKELNNFCVYCGKEVTDLKWISEWDNEFHYKSAKCGCGSCVVVKVDFMGSGHDSISDKLADKIEKELSNKK